MENPEQIQTIKASLQVGIDAISVRLQNVTLPERTKMMGLLAVVQKVYVSGTQSA